MIVIAAFLLVNCRTLQHIVLVLHTYPANDSSAMSGMVGVCTPGTMRSMSILLSLVP